MFARLVIDFAFRDPRSRVNVAAAVECAGLRRGPLMWLEFENVNGAATTLAGLSGMDPVDLQETILDALEAQPV